MPPQMHDRPTSAETAEVIGLKALGFLAAEDEALSAFLSASGLSPSEIPGMASDPLFLGGVLDFVLADDALCETFSRAAGLAPGAVLAARAALPGGADPHWT